jgi:hypothetical protein
MSQYYSTEGDFQNAIKVEKDGVSGLLGCWSALVRKTGIRTYASLLSFEETSEATLTSFRLTSIGFQRGAASEATDQDTFHLLESMASFSFMLGCKGG